MFTFNLPWSRLSIVTRRLAIILAGSILAVSCIENDIPYPRIQPNFTTFEVFNQSRQAAIDTVNRQITVYLDETADIYNVRLENYALNPSNSEWPEAGQWREGMDLSQPQLTTVSLYQDYSWQITAVQTIERYFTFDNQIGASSIEPEAHRVVAYINSRTDIAAVHVNTIKLGSTEAVMTPNLTDKTVNFTDPVTVQVSEFGRTVDWTIHIIPTDAEVNTDGADAWSMVAWLHGSTEAGKEQGFEYRVAGSEAWLTVPSEWITAVGGNYTARVIHLQPATTYEYRAVSGSNYGETLQFTTGATPLIPNGNFENWWLDGRIWCPWAQDGNPWWGTGNKGATTLGDSNSTPTDDTPTGTGTAARLETRFVGIGPLGKLAAGNIFAGSYVRTDGTNGVLSFGRPWKDRPTKLRGYLKYKTAPISSASEDFKSSLGQPDTCTVWVALIDSAEPFEIRTNPKNRNLFDPNGPEVVAYGRFQSGNSIEAYTTFEIELEYRSTSRVPTYLILTASSSKYGDYFTGGNGAVLYVDDFTFDWDY